MKFIFCVSKIKPGTEIGAKQSGQVWARVAACVCKHRWKLLWHLHIVGVQARAKNKGPQSFKSGARTSGK